MSGVWITGHMRSGTSMTAGVFGVHGVFFGECGGGSSRNRKGNWENGWLKGGLRGGGAPDGWPGSWSERLRAEGWDGEAPWGAKAVAVHAPEMMQLRPDVIVCCYRPKEQVLASCEAFRPGHRRFSREVRDQVVDDHWRIMAGLKERHPGRVIEISTPDLVAGDPSALLPAFDVLDVAFDHDLFSEWVDPELWHHEVA